MRACRSISGLPSIDNLPLRTRVEGEGWEGRGWEGRGGEGGGCVVSQTNRALELFQRQTLGKRLTDGVERKIMGYSERTDSISN